MTEQKLVFDMDSDVQHVYFLHS